MVESNPKSVAPFHSVHRSLKEEMFYKGHIKIDRWLIFVWVLNKCGNSTASLQTSASFLRFQIQWIPMNLRSVPHYTTNYFLDTILYFTDQYFLERMGDGNEENAQHCIDIRYLQPSNNHFIFLFYRKWKLDSEKPKNFLWNHTKCMFLNPDLHPTLLDSKNPVLSSMWHVHTVHPSSHGQKPIHPIHLIH